MDNIIIYIPLLSILMSLSVGIYVFSKNRSSFSNISFTLAMFSLAIVEFGKFFYVRNPWAIESDIWVKITWGGEIMMSFFWLLFSFVFARKDYRSILEKWRYILYLLLFLSISLTAATFLLRESIYPSAVNELPGIALGKFSYYVTVYLTLIFVFIIVNFENTFRNASAPVKTQIRYAIAAAIGTFAYFIYLSSEILLYSFVSLKILIAGSFIIIIFCMLFIFSIVRYRLLDVNVFISRYVVYRSASILAVGIYLLLAGGLLKLTAIVGGEDFQYIKPIIIFCAVLLFLLFFFSERIRRKAQVFINKNFFANKYDYRLVWTRFTEELGEAVTIDKLMPALAEMIAGIMWVQPVSVWLYDEEEKSFNIAGRFNLSYIPYERISKFDFNEEIFFEKEIVDLKKINNNELGIFSEKFREIIKSSDTQLVLPLKIKEDLLGFLLIGGTVTGDELNDEDYELLHTLSRQSAGIIQSVRLAEKLRVTQQMESISKITTFVVHDLKNLISSLEVLLDNAKEYIDNKEFQKDMLETLENTGKKMTQMIEKISTASNDSLFVFNTFNLIDIIKISIDELKLDKNPRVKLFKEYDENKVVPVWGDEKAIKKVVSNVLINALQAIPKKDGEIKISIEMNKFAVILKIKDNGAGMSEEFINNYLFKPFKTTKEGGLGIGLYQCRTIINAHRDAELYCESAVGKGTTFFIKLPVSDRGDTN